MNELLTVHEHLGTSPVVGGVLVAYNCWIRQLNIALGENHSGHATKILFPQHVRHLAILLMPFDFPTPNTFKSL
jgi:hypothetical protein